MPVRERLKVGIPAVMQDEKYVSYYYNERLKQIFLVMAALGALAFLIGFVM